MVRIEKATSIRDWVETKGDSRWKQTVFRFLEYVEGLHFDARFDKIQKLSLMIGCRESLQHITHPHHSSTAGLHTVLDVVDERLRELGYAVPEDCETRWGMPE